MDAIRHYSEVHEGETLPDLRGRRFSNALFSDCRLRNVAKARFIDCVFQNSKLEAADIRELLGVAVTLDCHTFQGTELSDVTLDAILYLLTLGKGNDAKRSAIEELIGPRRVAEFRRMFPGAE